MAFNKIFGIGLSKTGTKSLNLACRQLGFDTKHWDFEWDEIEVLDGVIDTPAAKRFKWLDDVYPNSKFILTVRSLEPWLDSCRRHFINPAKPGSRQHNVRKALYKCQVYDEHKFIHAYARHCGDVARHFEQDRDTMQQRLLLLDICAGDGWEKLCPFLGVQIPATPFPHAVEPRDRKAQEYWNQRYVDCKGSGAGSRGDEASFKACMLNDFIHEYPVNDVIDFGSGDGAQLDGIHFPQYTGFDISEVAVGMCNQRFESDRFKTFKLMQDYRQERAELTISLDVIYHLVDRITFDDYMRRLFDAAEMYVIIYSTNHNDNKPDQAPHIRHRKFTDWIDREQPNWKQSDWQLPTHPGKAKFFIYERVTHE